LNIAGNLSATLKPGPQGIGNTGAPSTLAPQAVADLYNFPLDGEVVPTGPIGLVEPGVGGAMSQSAPLTLQQGIAQYLSAVGEHGTGAVFVQGQDGQEYSESAAGERALDLGVVSAVNPNSNIWLYTGSGNNGNANSTIFTALQAAAYYDTSSVGSAQPAVVSTSFWDFNSMSPNSPYYYAYQQLYVDLALNSQTLLNAMGDEGSNGGVQNGLANIVDNHASAYEILVGGTSISSFATAATDPTLDMSYVPDVLSGNLGTIWKLVAGGLTQLPADATALQDFIETVWNQYSFNGTTVSGYTSHQAGSGGVDTTQPTPSYQVQYGLAPSGANPAQAGQGQTGRGAPDVAAMAGGNTSYLAPSIDLTKTLPSGGTSAAAPLWATLLTQINAVFQDQGLPNLGYVNDLLYLASAVAPASFNDITVGNNTSSYWLNQSNAIVPTGLGYTATSGYDEVSGLGTPNGLLLARTLSQVAHAQMYFPDVHDAIDSNQAGGWSSGAKQTLLVQATSTRPSTVSIATERTTTITGPAAAAYAWNGRFAEQSLQPAFDSNIVRMFDKQSQGAISQLNVSAGVPFSVSLDGTSTTAPQAALTSPFGFATFNATNNTGWVSVARAVMVAETALGADNQEAVVRMRSNGQDRLSIEFYRVDDLEGTIDGLTPGDPRYAEAAERRAYATTTGEVLISGPGYGNFRQVELLGINASDRIAMKLVNNTFGNTYWEFGQANEQSAGQPVTHVVNYGLNTFGWEDTLGGGDRDYNDLVVGVDFTSTSGRGLLVG
jgi:hypothetical protein